MTVNYEYLTGFKPISNDDNLKCTKFEIKTNMNTYTTVWKYKEVISIVDDETVRYREYDNNLKDYCNTLGIHQGYYRTGRIIKRPYRNKVVK